MHSEPIAYFVSRLPFLSSRTHHPPLPLSPVKSADTLLASSSVSPSLPFPFPSLFLSLSFIFDITKREEGGGNGGEPGPEGRRCV